MNKRPSFFVRMPLRLKFIRMCLPHFSNRRYAFCSMFGDISKASQLYIACGYTDMRSKVKVVEGGVIPAGATMRLTIVSDRTCTREAYRQATLLACSAVRPSRRAAASLR